MDLADSANIALETVCENLPNGGERRPGEERGRHAAVGPAREPAAVAGALPDAAARRRVEGARGAGAAGAGAPGAAAPELQRPAEGVGGRALSSNGSFLSFDTYPINNSTSFNGVGSVYPYFESGIISISDSNSGLFLVKKSQ